jgi:hypothetical protein
MVLNKSLNTLWSSVFILAIYCSCNQYPADQEEVHVNRTAIMSSQKTLLIYTIIIVEGKKDTDQNGVLCVANMHWRANV